MNTFADMLINKIDMPIFSSIHVINAQRNLESLHLYFYITKLLL